MPIDEKNKNGEPSELSSPQRQKSKEIPSSGYQPILNDARLKEIRDKWVEDIKANQGNLFILELRGKVKPEDDEENEVNISVKTAKEFMRYYETAPKLIEALEEENKLLQTNIKTLEQTLQIANSDLITLQEKNKSRAGENGDLSYQIGEKNKKIKELEQELADSGIPIINEVKGKTDDLLNLIGSKNDNRGGIFKVSFGFLAILGLIWSEYILHKNLSDLPNKVKENLAVDKNQEAEKTHQSKKVKSEKKDEKLTDDVET